MVQSASDSPILVVYSATIASYILSLKEKVKILSELLIYGPTPPLRGGIPRHTHFLANAICSNWTTTVYSPDKLYPNWLYPGESQSEGKGSELGARLEYGLVRDGDLRMIFQVVVGKRFDVALIPWWTTARAPQTLALIFALRLRRTPFAFFCHNVVPHDSGSVSRFLTRLILRNARAHLVQGDKESQVLTQLIPGSNPCVVSHPSWESSEAKPSSKTSNRFLFFGFVRAYKGIELLIDAIPLIDPSLDYEIVIMGEVWEKRLEERLNKLADNFPQVRLTLRYVSDAEMAKAFQSSRAILMPYLSATASGVMALAKQYQKPVIASDIPAFRSEMTEVSDGLLFDRTRAASLASSIEAFLKNPELASSPWSHLASEPYDWVSLAKDVSEALEKARHR